MVTGMWGADFIFRVSEKDALIIQSIGRSVGAEWATHSRIGAKDRSEFLRPSLQGFTFTMVLDAGLGVKPRANLAKLEELVEKGAVNPLILGGQRVGRNRFCITSTSEKWEYFLPGGELLRATVSVTMKEYL